MKQLNEMSREEILLEALSYERGGKPTNTPEFFALKEKLISLNVSAQEYALLLEKHGLYRAAVGAK